MAKSKIHKMTDNAYVKLTGTKYCQSCLVSKPVEGGLDIIKNKKRYGWRCAGCMLAKKKAVLAIKNRLKQAT